MKLLEIAKRNPWLIFHLSLSSFILPSLLILPFTGGLHLLGFKAKIEEVKLWDTEISGNLDDMTEMEVFFKKELVLHGVDLGFESIKKSGSEYILRPSNREHVVARVHEPGKITFYKLTPNFQGRLMEFHKGHGPSASKPYGAGVALCVCLVLLSGLVMGLKSPNLRSLVLISGFLGSLAFLGFYVL
jgi:hypothetical protein